MKSLDWIQLQFVSLPKYTYGVVATNVGDAIQEQFSTVLLYRNTGMYQRRIDVTVRLSN